MRVAKQNNLGNFWKQGKFNLALLFLFPYAIIKRVWASLELGDTYQKWYVPTPLFILKGDINNENNNKYDTKRICRKIL